MSDIVTIAPAVSGILSDLKIIENQYVEEGDTLFVIDQRPYRYEVALRQADLELSKLQEIRAEDLVEEAEDDFEAAEAVLRDAQATQARIQTLVEDGFAAEQRLDPE